MPTIGIEPTTYGLQNRCSTIEPSRQVTFPILVKKKLTVKSFFFFYLFLAFCLHNSIIYVYNTLGVMYIASIGKGLIFDEENYIKFGWYCRSCNIVRWSM